MFETDDELAELDRLLEASFSRAGTHLTGIIAPERRLDAADLVRYLVGIRHLVVATVRSSGEPRCSAVDGLFVHGSFWFTTGRDSLKANHLNRRMALSAAHVRGDDVGIFVHGEGRVIHGATPEADRLRPIWQSIYNSSPEEWVEQPGDARYVQIVAGRLFTYAFNRERFEELTHEGPTPFPEA